jgi:transmembrane sensor
MKEREVARSMDRWAEALTWYMTLREADEEVLTRAMGRNWQDWYAETENRRTFDKMSCLLGDRNLYRKRHRPRQVQLAEDPYDLSVPIAEWRRDRALSGTLSRRLLPGKWWWFIGATCTVAIGVFISLFPLRLAFNASAPGTVVYRTDVGEYKDIHLNDGSSIILGGLTRLSIAFSAQRRSVSFIAGQAWFKVAHDPHRPFVVTAGDGTITDIGTAFLVTRESNRVVVTVTEGTVRVSARPATWIPFRIRTTRPALTPIQVRGGEQIAFSDNGSLGRVKPTDASAVATWAQGQLTFDDQPLWHVIETVNRYSAQHIVATSSAGALRFSGIVSNNGIEDWLQSLPAVFPVSVEEHGASIYIQMRSATVSAHEPSPKMKP